MTCLSVGWKKDLKNKFTFCYTQEVWKASHYLTHHSRVCVEFNVTETHTHTYSQRALTYGIFLWVAYFDPEYVIQQPINGLFLVKHEDKLHNEI